MTKKKLYLRISKRLEKKRFLRRYQAFRDKLARNAKTGSFEEKYPSIYRIDPNSRIKDYL